jgi:hypothetical protein
MNLHLFSPPAKDDIRDILAAGRPYLEGKDDPVVAYLPAGSLGDTYQEYNEKAFRGLANLTEQMKIFTSWEKILIYYRS